MPGVGLLRFVQLFMKSGMATARRVTRIAQHRLMGKDWSRLAPAGFNATMTHVFVAEAVSMTVALRARLRARLLALAGEPEPPLVPELPKADRAPRGRAKGQRVTVIYQQEPGDPHDWPALAKPLRIGPNGVAAALQLIEGKSNRVVVTEISDFLRRALAELGAAADVARIAALEAGARKLCEQMEEAEAAAEPAPAAEPAAAAGGVRPDGGPAASDAPRSGVDADPPKRPPDG